MKEMFKKTFGIVLGIYAGRLAAAFIDGMILGVDGILNKDEKASEKEESETTEES